MRKEDRKISYVLIGLTQQIVIYRTGAAAPLALPMGELSAEQAD